MTIEALNRGEPNGISVLVSGGGVGGLMTALECWRRGCEVRILERSKTKGTSGDSFVIGPTAIDAFKNWPQMQKKNDDIAYNPLMKFCNHKGETTAGPMEMSALASKDASATRITRHSRPKMHNMLYEQLTRIGIQVEFGNEVVDYFENVEDGRAGVALKDGSRLDADLVVAADGVRGASWSLVAGRPVPARSSGNAVFRVAYPVDIAMADPMVAERFPLTEEGRSVIELWNAPGFHSVWWRNEDEMTWAITHPDDGSAEESWSQRVDPEVVLKFTATVADWPEVADRVIRTAPANELVDWKMMWRDPQPNWTSPGGRVIQLGDAAHTFLPDSGNGGTQAIEDAVSLAASISMVPNKHRIPDATRVHNLLRFERVSCLQAFGVQNRAKNSSEAGKGSKTQPKRPHIGKWILNHNPEQYAFDNFEAALAHIQDGTPFKNTNVPPGMEYKPWTIDGLLEAQQRGEPTILDGDWE